MYQIIIMKKTRFLVKEDARWGGNASFAGKSFDSAHWFCCEGCFKGSPVIKYSYLACLKVLLWLVFTIYGLFIFMVNWKEAYLEPCKTSAVELFAKLIINWKPLIFFHKELRLRRLKGFRIRLTCIKSKLKVAIWNNMCLLPFQYN